MLPEPKPRKPSHTRKMTFEGFSRDDGLWDIEGHLQDTKPEVVTVDERVLEAFEPIHDMAIRVTLDANLFIVDIDTVMSSHPLLDCPGALPPMKSLIGIQIGKGWRKKVDELLGKTIGCSHLRELLYSIATAAYQTITNPMESEIGAGIKSHFIDGCYAWNSSGEAVLKYYPAFHKSMKSD